MTGYPTPNYTQTPNALFDIDMRDMSESELKVTLAIVRKIVGYHKTQPEPVSYSQLEELTGLSRQGVVDGVKAALKRGRIKKSGHGKRGVNLFTINTIDQSTQLTSTSLDSRQEPVSEVDTQKKTKETPKEKDSADVAADTPKKPRKRSAAQLRLDGMVNALVDAFGYDPDKITSTKWSELRAAGKELLDAHATPDDVKPLHTWCNGKGWTDFTSMALAKRWPEYAAKRNGRRTNSEPLAALSDDDIRHASGDFMTRDPLPPVGGAS